MFFILIIPFSALSWFFGLSHAKGKTWAKWGFLALLLSTLPLEVQGLVIFITAFFILGFLYAQEGNISALFLRLKDTLGDNTPPSVQEEGEQQKSPPSDSEQPPGAKQEQTKPEGAPGFNRDSDELWEEIRKKREEEMKSYRKQQQNNTQEKGNQDGI